MKNIIQNSFYMFLFCCIFTSSKAVAQHDISSDIKPGMIILLNGTSSAGKTTLAKYFCEQYPTFCIASLDDYTRTHPCGSWHTKCCNFYKEVRKKALDGQNVMVDTVLYHKHYTTYDILLKNLDYGHDVQAGPIKLIKILVYCPLDILVEHVQQRNALGNSLEKRTVQKAFIAFLTLYAIQSCPSEIIIDIIDPITIKAALVQSLTTLSHTSHKLIKKQLKINKKIVRKFNLDTSNRTNLTPKHSWNLIINTGIQNPEKIAEQIEACIKLQRNL